MLEAKADFELKNEYGQTPLGWASLNGHEAVVTLELWFMKYKRSLQSG